MEEQKMFRVSVDFATQNSAKSFIGLLEGCGYTPSLFEVTAKDVTNVTKQEFLRKELTPFG